MFIFVFCEMLFLGIILFSVILVVWEMGIFGVSDCDFFYFVIVMRIFDMNIVRDLICWFFFCFCYEFLVCKVLVVVVYVGVVILVCVFFMGIGVWRLWLEFGVLVIVVWVFVFWVIVLSFVYEVVFICWRLIRKRRYKIFVVVGEFFVVIWFYLGMFFEVCVFLFIFVWVF